MVTRRATCWWKLSWIILLNILQTNVEAGLTKRSSRMVREVYPEIEPENDGNQAQVCVVGDVVYAIDELVPAEQPCLKCRCQPPGVQCESIKCIKKSGCKAIHRPNKCCPDYQCECHHEGKIYANGERLKTSTGGACKVCYCRGGEIQCAEVTCYLRTDCEGKTVPGQCCPKYDHCPPKEPLLGRSSTTTDLPLPNISKNVLEVWPLTKSHQNSSDQSTSPKPYENQNANKIENENSTFETTIKITRATQTDFTEDAIKQIEEPKITIQEIIPEIKEIPITAPSNQNNHVFVKESKVQNDNDLGVTDSEPDSSEISEVFQHPPPVLRIGDKLLFLKQGELVPEKDVSTPASIITIIGAEGLQRGYEDSVEFHDVPTKTHDDSEYSLFNNSNDLEPKVSESTHILSLVKHKKSATTTEKTTTISTTDSTEEYVTESPTTNLAETTSLVSILEEEENKTEFSSMETTPKTIYDILIEENPAYPAIPEVMSPEHFESNETQQTINAKRTVPEVSESKTVIEPTTDSELITTEEGSSLPNISTGEIEMTISSSTEYDKSMESIEESTNDSGENTTPKNDHASVISTENASVEPSESTIESEDMLKDVTTSNADDGETTKDNTEQENTSLSIEDVEMINSKTEQENIGSVIKDTVMANNITEDNSSIIKDVEMINFTHADYDIKREKLELPAKLLDKRESSAQGEADEIFRELEAELNADNTERTQTAEEEKEESDKIFQELLEETSTPRSIKKGDKNAETIQKVTDAIAKLTLRGGKNGFDTNILGVISNFFSSQYRYDRRK